MASSWFCIPQLSQWRTVQQTSGILKPFSLKQAPNMSSNPVSSPVLLDHPTLYMALAAFTWSTSQREEPLKLKLIFACYTQPSRRPNDNALPHTSRKHRLPTPHPLSTFPSTPMKHLALYICVWSTWESGHNDSPFTILSKRSGVKDVWGWFLCQVHSRLNDPVRNFVPCLRRATQRDVTGIDSIQVIGYRYIDVKGRK